MRPLNCDWLPSFCKEIFLEEIRKYNLTVINESSTSIAFQNDYIYWGLFIDDFYDVKSGYYFDKNKTQERLDVTQLMAYNLQAKDEFYNGLYKIFVEKFNKYETLDEIIKSHFLSFFEGEKPVYYEQALNAPIIERKDIREWKLSQKGGVK